MATCVSVKGFSLNTEEPVRDFAGVKIILAIVLLQVLSGCVKVDLTGKATATATTTTTLPPFQVTAFSPDTPVDGLTAITVTFSRDADDASITGDTFEVELDGVKIPGTISHSDDATKGLYTATFTPTLPPPLARSYSHKLYSVKVSLSSNIKSSTKKTLEPYTRTYKVAHKWDEPAPIDVDTVSVLGQQPVMGVDSQGNAIAAWLQESGLWVARYSATTGVWTPTELVSDLAQSISKVRLVVNANGRTMLAWVQPSTDDYTHLYAKYYNGLEWGDTAQVDTASALVDDYQLAIDGSGRVIMAWSQPDPVNNVLSLWANRYDGSSWKSAILLEDDLDPIAFPLVTMNTVGNAMIAWRPQFGDYDFALYARNYLDPNGPWAESDWAAVEQIDTYPDGILPDDILPSTPGFLQIAMNASGNVLAAWRANDGSAIDGDDYSLYANYFAANTADSNWLEAKLLEQEQRVPGSGVQNSVVDLRLAVTSTGSASVVWIQQQDQLGSKRYVMATSWASDQSWPSSSWTPATYLSTNTGLLKADKLAIAVDASGNATALWRQYAENTATTIPGLKTAPNLVWSRYRPTLGRWTTSTILDSNNNANVSDAVNNPSVVATPDGGALAVWHQYDSVRDLFASRFR